MSHGLLTAGAGVQSTGTLETDEFWVDASANDVSLHGGIEQDGLVHFFGSCGRTMVDGEISAAWWLGDEKRGEQWRSDFIGFECCVLLRVFNMDTVYKIMLNLHK